MMIAFGSRKFLAVSATLGFSLAAILESSAWAADPKYPDGIVGQIAVIQRVSQSSPYTVPSGQNLYITNVAASNQRCGRLSFSCYLTATGATNLLDPYSFQPSNPIILGAGTVVSSTASTITFDINGFLVPATVTPLVTDLAPSSAYTVPSGQNLYILRLGTGSNAISPPLLTVGGVTVYYPLTEPTLIGGGQSIVNAGSSSVTIMAYLKAP